MERLQAKARARYAFAEFLGSIGKRCTPERLQVLDTAIEQRKPFSANTLLELCQQNCTIKICRATMFNTLPLLVQCGLLRKTSHDRDVLYESISTKNHINARQILVCKTCGKTHRQNSPSLSTWITEQSFRGFVAEPNTAILYVDGECTRCRRKSKK